MTRHPSTGNAPHRTDVLREVAEQEAYDLGPAPSDPDDCQAWDAQRSAAVESLAMLANWNADLLADAAVGSGQGRDLASDLLADAAAECPLSYQHRWDDD